MLLAAHLVDMVQFEVFEEEQEQGRDTLYNDLLVSVHIDAQLHALENSDATMGRGGVSAKRGLERGLQGARYSGQRQHIQESQNLGDLNFCTREISSYHLGAPLLFFSSLWQGLITWQRPPTYLCNQSLALMLPYRPLVLS